MYEQWKPDDRIALLLSCETVGKWMEMISENEVTILDAADKDSARRLCGQNGCTVLLYEAALLRAAEDVFWGNDTMRMAICVDAEDPYAVPEGVNLFMNRELWEMVGMTATSAIEVGGWKNSYNGKPFSEEEMAEFSENVYRKLQPYLHPQMRVLEIGCASGLTMYRIAPEVGYYLGTDLSAVAIERNRSVCADFPQINLVRCAAHEIGDLPDNDFDLVIINSVAQCFHGFHYLEKLMEILMKKTSEKAILFWGDIMDLDHKDALYASMRAYADANNTPMIGDLSYELMIPHRYFETLPERFRGMQRIECAPKYHTIANELTNYRYDVLVFVDHSTPEQPATRYSFGSGALEGVRP